MERPRVRSEIISRTHSLLEEINNISDEEETWFEDDQVMMDSTALSSHNTYDTIIDRASKLQLKQSPKTEHKTELYPAIERFSNDESMRRSQLNKTIRSNEDFSAISEAIP
ncbi:hypothetical protein HPULCUR_004253 [Helicostylum pulchrum]|uniref:Uncharacterized protein n=1 Tax=Helicostylum pulchrum TaxID=562976 RepID=A0ABP9XXR1_9FUNG